MKIARKPYYLSLYLFSYYILIEFWYLVKIMNSALYTSFNKIIKILVIYVL